MSKEPIFVDYCKEAMELYLSKLQTNDLNLLTFNIAKLIISNNRDNLEIVIYKADEKGVVTPVRVPLISLLRTDIIKDELKSIGISNNRISMYIDVFYNKKENK